MEHNIIALGYSYIYKNTFVFVSTGNFASNSFYFISNQTISWTREWESEIKVLLLHTDTVAVQSEANLFCLTCIRIATASRRHSTNEQ